MAGKIPPSQLGQRLSTGERLGFRCALAEQSICDLFATSRTAAYDGFKLGVHYEIAQPQGGGVEVEFAIHPSGDKSPLTVH